MDENGREALVWDTERGTKTRTGATNSHQRAFNPTAFAFDQRCPVEIFREFTRRRPVEACTPDARFYFTPIPVNRLKVGTEKWFYGSPMGKNSIGKMLQGVDSLINEIHATTNSGTPMIKTSKSKVSNHSVRKTSICRLLQNKVHPLHVAQLSGHKNLNSLMSYNVASEEQQREMSDIINGQDLPSTSSSTSVRPPVAPAPAIIDTPSSSSVVAPFDERPSAPAASSSSSSISPFTASSAQTISQHRSNIEVTGNISEGLFRGATIQNVYVFNGPPPVFHQYHQEQQPPAKRRRLIIDSSDEE